MATAKKKEVQRSNDTQRLRDTLDTFSVLMLHTFDRTGLLQSRPMTKAKVDDDGSLWFLTSSKEAIAGEVTQIDQVSATGQGGRLYLAVQGHAEVHKNSEKAEELWTPAMQLWFPEGPRQADLVLIKLQPKTAEVWDNRGATGLRFAFNAAKAWWKGKAVQELAPDAAREHLTL